MSYFEREGLNFSTLKHLYTDPLKFRSILNGEKVWPTQSMIFGTALHTKILEPYRFDDNVLVVDQSNSVESKLSEMAEYIAKTFEINSVVKCTDQMIINAAEMYSYQSKWKKETIIEKTRSDKNFDQLLAHYYLIHNSKDKIVISSNEYETICKIEDNCEADEFVSDIMNTYGYNYEYEYECYGEINGLKTKCKIDFMKWDSSKLTILDIKSTSKMYNFKGEIFKNLYNLQLVFYFLHIQELLPDHEVELYFLAASTVKPYPVRLFKMSDETIQKSIEQVYDLLERAKWHMENEKWNIKEVYDNNGYINF